MSEVPGITLSNIGISLLKPILGDKNGGKPVAGEKDKPEKGSFEAGYDNSVPDMPFYFGSIFISKTNTSIDWKYQDYGEFIKTSIDKTILDENADLGETWSLSLGENYGFYNDRLKFGVRANYFIDTIDNADVSGLSFDAGMMLQTVLLLPIKFDLDFRDVTGKLSSDDPLPARADADLTVSLPIGSNNKINVMAGFQKMLDKNVIDPGYANIGGSWETTLGIFSLEIGGGINFSENGTGNNANFCGGGRIGYKNIDFSYIISSNAFNNDSSTVGASIRF